MKRVLYLFYKIKIWLLSKYYVLFPRKGTYKGLYRYRDVFGVKKYIFIRNKIFSNARKAIQKKEKKTIRIIMSFCSEWCATDIYNYFHEKEIDIGVVLSPYFNGPDEKVREEYIRSREFCEAKGFQYIDLYNTENWKFIGKDIREVQGDVVIYVKPWMAFYPDEVSLYNMPLSSVTCYIPYGFLLMKKEPIQFNQLAHNMFTYIYCESESYLEMYEKYCDIGSSHVEFSGYAKMDPFAEDKAVSDREIWKGLADDSHKTKIIYSPHWNFQDGFATFMDNGLQILEYAETHPDTTSWIYKPHPHLEVELVCHQKYMSGKEYQEYVDRWKNLSNAEVYIEGDYTDIFKTSDCMINDSLSFIAEYMYTHKPMLLLQGKNIGYNQFGRECVANVYKCDGKDIEGIARFIENVRLGKDDMRESRERFFDEKLNYYEKRGQLASEYIGSRISDIIGAQ